MRRVPLLCLTILCAWTLCTAQQDAPYRVLEGAAPDGFGGGESALPEVADHITSEQRARIRAAIEASRERLRQEGTLMRSSLASAPTFGWPLKLAPGLLDEGYHGISNFVDLDPAFPGVLLDYSCGDRSYDLDSGYNHQGIDFFTWPWGWNKMDDQEVWVVAAAPGQIVLREDGNFDRNCGFDNGDWNAVYIEHADGSITWYGHMKRNSLTSKQVGEFVQEGEYLGVVGSSGNSTGPHLHMETYDAEGNLIEPYAGPCNSTTASSWWRDQQPYYDSALNRVTTGYAPAVFPSCPNPESPNVRVNFDPGPQIYFTMYYRDQLVGQLSTFTIRRPDGSTYANWDHSSPEPHYAGSWWYWWFNIPAGEQQGTWTFTVNFLGQTIERAFSIGSAASGRVPQYPVQGSLLTASRGAGSTVDLAWGSSCTDADNDFVVYEGALGDFGSHAPTLCSTAGVAAATITPAGGSRYFLVAPRNSNVEGSRGRDSAGTLRPAGTSSCVAENIAPDCP